MNAVWANVVDIIQTGLGGITFLFSFMAFQMVRLQGDPERRKIDRFPLILSIFVISSLLAGLTVGVTGIIEIQNNEYQKNLEELSETMCESFEFLTPTLLEENDVGRATLAALAFSTCRAVISESDAGVTEL